MFEATQAKLKETNFSSLPPLMNPPKLAGCDDLTTLSYLHEPGVLYNIQLRYQQEQIYTYSGIVLIAMNPFRRMNIYTAEIMREYSGKQRRELEPHLFAVAEEAYRNMIRERKNQSIIISGESGAGKTQSAKYIMRYFAVVDELGASRTGSLTDLNAAAARQSVVNSTTAIEDAVLSTNPIMEAFGNSKTTRNDNSSRFGKYIEIAFENKEEGKGVRITGAKIRTYLLERSRLIFQPATERNYHIFYQLCAAAPAAERKELGLGSWEQFFYLNQGGTGVVPGIDDVAEFEVTQKALSTIGISVSMQWDVFRICAALLHIGNIAITQSRDESDISDSDPALIQAARLLEVDQSSFKKWIVKKQIVTRSEKIMTSLNQIQATTGRDSISKFIYSMLFDWIVKIVNSNLSREELSATGRFIGVLDIYGFEHFKRNSFEQFCINYANEKLQQEFNQHVFKLEQEEYVAEEISWSFISFNDNQPCIDMIESKLGILDLLDEECRLPSGTDNSLITKLYQRFGTAEHGKFFEKPRFGQDTFTVKHYACDVAYNIEGFLEKNKDTVADEQLAVLNESKFAFLREVVKIEEPVEVEQPKAAPGRRGGAGGSKKPTLGSIFKGSLVQLMSTIRQTEVHYIRCIKPNQAKRAFEFEAPMVLSQLRACGVLETIRISCAGYPNRQTYDEFAQRFYFLIKSSEWKCDDRELTKKIVNEVMDDRDKYQVGKTKIFFRAGQIAYIEKLRSDKFRDCIVKIQKYMRRFVYQMRFKRLRQAAVRIQTTVRGFQARMLYKKMRETHAAVLIQKHTRRWCARRKYMRTLRSITVIQRSYRRYKSRKKLVNIRRHRAALRIQKVVRGHLARKKYRRTIHLISRLQGCVRRRDARKQLKALRIEARSFGKLKENNYKLENKLVELSQGLSAKSKENIELTDKFSSLEAQLGAWKEKYHKLDADVKRRLGEAQDEVQLIRKEVVSLTEAKESLAKENEKNLSMIHKRDQEVSQLQSELSAATEEAKKLRDQAKTAQKDAEDPAAVATLKKEVVALREQVGRLLAGKYRPDRVTEQLLNKDYMQGPNGRTGSMSSGAGGYLGRSAAPMSFFESAAQATAQMTASIAESLSRSASGNYLDRPNFDSIDDLRRAGRLELLSDTEPKDRPVRMLEADELEDEIVSSLIANLRIPLPSAQSVATKREVFFPAHLMGYIMTNLLEHNLVNRLRILAHSEIEAIKNLTMKFDDDYVSAFWLSNSYELFSVTKRLKDGWRPSAAVNSAVDPEGEQMEPLVAIIHEDFEKLMLELYHGWLKELKKRLSNIIVPAVIENQSLPGYICKQSGGIWGKWAKTSSTTQFSIDQLITFLNKLNKTMKCYYMDAFFIRNLLVELFRIIGATSFNHLLMRKNFCTWKRGNQAILYS